MYHKSIAFYFLSLLLLVNTARAQNPQRNGEIEKVYHRHYPVFLGISSDGAKIISKSIIKNSFSLDLITLDGGKSLSINQDLSGQVLAKWSKDQKQIIYFIDPQGRQDYKLQLLNIASNTTTHIPTTRITYPKIAWSMDSRYLAYLSPKNQLVIIDLFDANKIIYQSKESILPRSSFAWSNISNSIAFALSSRPDTILIYDPTLGTHREIRMPGKIEKIAWANTSKKIYAIVTEGNKRKLLEASQGVVNEVNYHLYGEASELFVIPNDLQIALNISAGFKLKYNIISRDGSVLHQGEGSVVGSSQDGNRVFVARQLGSVFEVVSLDLIDRLQKTLYSSKKGAVSKFIHREFSIDVGGRSVPSLLWSSAQPSQKLLVKAHGGPHLNYNNQLRPEIEVFLNEGIDVLLVNYGGSSGYDVDFLSEERHAANDIAAVANYFSENHSYKKLFLWGDSYGSKLVIEAHSLLPNISGVIATSYAGGLVGSGKIPKNILVFQGVNDFQCGPDCTSDELKDYWKVESSTEWLFPIAEEGHSFRRIHSWSMVLSQMIKFINR